MVEVGWAGDAEVAEAEGGSAAATAAAKVAAVMAACEVATEARAVETVDLAATVAASV